MIASTILIRPTHRRRGPRGFTLVELMLVLMILAILAALVVPRYRQRRDEAEETAIMNNVRALRNVIEHERAATGRRPHPLDPNAFNGSLPEHPQAVSSVPRLEYYTADNASHPASKVLTASSAGAYWYNVNTGVVRARIEARDTTARTVALYNRVNQCSLTALAE